MTITQRSTTLIREVDVVAAKILFALSDNDPETPDIIARYRQDLGRFDSRAAMSPAMGR